FDPQLNVADFLSKLVRWGLAGATTFPSVIHLDDHRRRILETRQLGYGREIELLVNASRRGMMAIGYTRPQPEAPLMYEADIEASGRNFTLKPAATTGELAEISLQEIAARAAEMARVAHSVNRSIVCLLGGGPISKPGELMDVCRETGTQGFIGG